MFFDERSDQHPHNTSVSSIFYNNEFCEINGCLLLKYAKVKKYISVERNTNDNGRCEHLKT